jgi:hypothetical protein
MMGGTAVAHPMNSSDSSRALMIFMIANLVFSLACLINGDRQNVAMDERIIPIDVYRIQSSQHADSRIYG